MTTQQKKLTGLELAVDLIEQNPCEWGGNDEPEKIAAARFAVVIERDEEGWVVAADSWQDVANHALGCLSAEYYTEWVSEVYDVATGDVLGHRTYNTVTVEFDGVEYVATDRPASSTS